MSTSANVHDEDEAGRSSKTETEESSRNWIKGEECALNSPHPTSSKNNVSKEVTHTGRKPKPKLLCAQAVLSSKLEPESVREEPAVNIPNHPRTPKERKPEPKQDKMVHCSATNATDLRNPTAEERKKEDNEKDRSASDKKSSLVETGEVSRKSTWRAGQRERWKGKRRERLGGSVEDIAEEDETDEKEMNRGIRLKDTLLHWGPKKSQDREFEKRDEAERGEMHQDSIELEDSEGRGAVPHRVFSRVLAHSFASSSSSSSSSFNCSSAESDEVFSEGEEMSKRKETRRCRSWRTFLTMMQWSKRRQSSWVQLAGHQGNVQLGERGEVLKRFNQVEDSCLQMLMSDPLRHFVPQYYGHISRDGESYIRLEDLLSGLKQPVIMDCKMGIRTYQEDEINKAKVKASLRTDMYQKMMKVDPTAPTAEEHSRKGVTKLRYMQWRDNTSSTSTLGFRVEGIMTEDGTVLRDFNKTRTKTQVTETLLFFTKKQEHVLKAYQSRLEALKETLKESTFFYSHEIIGGSLLFVHDRSNKANIWMIDFGKTMPMPENMHLRHDVPWVEGNREDGYLIGLTALLSLVQEAIREARSESLDSQHPETDLNESHTDTQHQPLLHESTSVFKEETTDAVNLE